MNQSLDIVTYHEEGAGFLVPQDSISAALSPHLYRAGTKFISAGTSSVGIDLSKATMVTSLGLSIFLRLDRETREAGGQLVLFSCQPAVLEVIRATKLGDVLRVVLGRAEAVAALTS